MQSSFQWLFNEFNESDSEAVFEQRAATVNCQEVVDDTG
jgi:hypothetical protein